MKWVMWSGVVCGPGEGRALLHPEGNVNPVTYYCEPFQQLKSPTGHDMPMNKALQMVQNWFNLLPFARLIYYPFHIFLINVLVLVSFRVYGVANGIINKLGNRV